MKKRLLYMAVVVICLAIITGSTFAYFTTEDTARNVITSGAIEVTVEEQQLVGGELQPYARQPIPVMPDTTVSKIVSVRSAQQDAWIRVSYTVTVLDAQKQEMDVPAEELAQVIGIAPDAENWTLTDGWWYYKEAIGAGDATEPLFEEVVFSGPYMGNEYQGCTVIIDVVAQGVQQANNGDTVAEAQGWPET